MKVISSIREMKRVSRSLHKKNKTIGFVPTMGYLHDGHVSLIKKARRECDAVVVSIFVNPAQFGPKEDFKKYPRDIKRDSLICRKSGADIIFAPPVGEMYPEGYSTFVEVTGRITESLCGLSRPGHFKGVATVVAKLFNIVGPRRSYFGMKDLQQTAVIRKMAGDLDMDVDVVLSPTVREKDGLAMSSRNMYLSAEERKKALIIQRSLKEAKVLVEKGERSAARIKEMIRERLKSEKALRIDYVEAVRVSDLAALNRIERKKTLVAVAAFIGGVRLIDNISI